MSGWIKIHRQILDWEWYSDNNAFRVFMHLILKANHKEKRYKGIELNCGSVITSRDILSLETGLSVQQIRTALDKLKSTNEITIETSSKGTIIQVVNYAKYQLSTNESTNEQPTNNQQVTTNNKEKKERSIFKAPSLEELNAFCLENNLELNASDFLNYYDSNGWMVGKNKMKDWKATVRRWSKPKQEVIFDPLVEKARAYGYIK
jgi:hypothetical protein